MPEKQIVMVTGSTDGIGLHTCKKLANEVDTLILHGRNPERLRLVESEIKSLVRGNTSVHCVLGDLAVIDDVRTIASQVREKVSHLSCLINNAGVYLPNYHVTVDGLEQTFAVNVVAPYLLTSLLRDLLEKCDQPRVINTSSISQSWDVPGELQLNERNYSGHTAYSQSKLFDRMITVGQAEQMPKVLCLTLDPGTVNTKMLLEGWGQCGIPVNQADDTYWLATTQELNLNNSGDYFVNRRLSPNHNFNKQDIYTLFTFLDRLIKC